MRLPWISWDKTLQRLGFVRRKVRRPREDFRRPQVEQLETRDLLTTVSVQALQNASEPNGTGQFRISCSPAVPTGTGFPLNVYIGFSGTAAWGMGAAPPGSGIDYSTGDTVPTGIYRTINPGQDHVDFDFTVIDDSTQENTETVIVTIQTSPNYTITTGTATANIFDNDSTVVSISATDSQASEAGSGTGTFTISASPAPTSNLTVNFTRSGTATYTTDYSDSPTSITIPANSSSTTVTITPSDDEIYESGGETVIYTLDNGSNYALGATTSATINISENDSAPGISISDWSGAESGNASFTVTLSSASSQNVTVNYATQNGTATTAGSDYTANSGTLTFTPGQLTKTIPVTVNNDTADEINETFNVVLSAASGGSITDGTGVGTILDDDGPTVSITDVTVNEGSTASFTVSLSAASPQVITVDYETQDWEAVEPDDYSPATGTLTFSANSSASQTITVATQGDALDEINERFQVVLSNLVNAFSNDSLGVGTIQDDDPLPTLSINNMTVAESAGTATFTVTLSPVSGRSVSVHYATTDQTASSSSDYTSASGDLTFAAGQTSKTITVPISNDTADENDETYLVSLSSVTNASISGTAGAGTGTITDDDGPPALSIDDPQVDEAGQNLVFTVHLNYVSGKQVTVNYATTDLSATQPDDYTQTSGTLTIAAGDLSGTISVPILNDSEDEVDETLQLTLSGAVDASISDAIGIGTIDDNDGPAISINDIFVNEAASTADFTVSLSTASLQEVRVHWQTSNGTALAGSDYTAASGTAIIPAGQTSTTVSVAIVNDVRDEDDQTFNVTLTSPVDATIADGSGVGTIVDNDAAPTISINDAGHAEEDANITFTVTLSEQSEKTVSVQYGTSDMSATGGVDYYVTAGTLTFDPLVTSLPLGVTIKADTEDEIDETFKMLLSIPVNVSIGDGEGIGTIDDNDGPSISISGITVAESAGTAVLTVTLSVASYQDIYVDYATAPGSATAPADYGTASGTLHFLPNTTTQTISVSIVNDAEDEVDQDFYVNLFSAIDGFLGEEGSSATVTIDDNDGPKVYVDDSTVVEGTGSTKTMEFPLHLDAQSPQTVTVNFHTSSLSAVAPADFTETAGSVSFAPNTTTATISISIVTDSNDESDESFQLILDDAFEGVIENGTALGTIDDDDGPTVSIGDAVASESAGSMAFVVSIPLISPQDIVVTYSTANLTATAGADYTGTSSSTVTIPHGQLSATISVPILEDSIDETNEQFRVQLLGALDGTISSAANIGTGRIIDNDLPPTVSVNDVEVAENGSFAHFTVSLNATSGQLITVAFATASGTGVSGTDFTSTSGNLTFNPGDTVKYVDVPILDDTTPQQDLTFFLNLGSLTHVGPGDGQGVGTILDNEPRVKIEVDDSIAKELNTGSDNGRFKITKTGNASNPMGQIQVFYQVGGTATNGQDYSGPAGWVMLAATGTAEAYVDINVNNDSLREGSESVELTLQDSSSYAINQSAKSAAIEILDNDNWTVGVETIDGHAYEIGQDKGKFRISRSGESDNSQALTVNVQLSGTAAFNDYSLNPSSMGQLTIPANAWSTDIEVIPVSDSQTESPETVVLSVVSDPSHYAVNTATATVTIHDGSANQPPTLDSLVNLTIPEDASQQSINLAGITAGAGETQALSVSASTSNADLITSLAVAYTSAQSGGIVTFIPGANLNGSAVITVKVEDELGGTVTQTMSVTVTPVNDPPRVPPPGSELLKISGREDTPIDVVMPGDDGESPSGAQPIWFKILSLPTHGTLYHYAGGLAVAVGEFLDSRQVHYVPFSNYNGLDGFSYQVAEYSQSGGGGGGEGEGPEPDLLSEIAAIMIDDAAVDDEPIISAPAGVQLDSNHHAWLSGSNGISISDIDVAEAGSDGKVLVRLTANNGNISVAAPNPLPAGLFVSTPSQHAHQITIRGPLALVNSILESLEFEQDPAEFGAEGEIVVKVSDLGNVGLDGPKTDEKRIRLFSDPQNNPPVNHLPAGPIFVRPCDHDFPIPMSVTDEDAGNANVHVDIGVYGAGTIKLLGITGDYIWLEGPLDYVNQRLAQLVYNPPVGAALPQTAQVFIYTTDMGHSGTGGAKDDYDELTIKLNDEPTVRIVATDPHAYEQGLNPGFFTVYRGTCTSSPNDFAQSLTVNYTVDVTIPNFATPGADYQTLSGSVTIPAGQLSALIGVFPNPDAITEPDEYVKVDLVGYPPSSNPNYGTPGDPGGYGNYYYVDPSASTATVTIHDYTPTYPFVGLSATDAYASEEKAPGNLNDDGEVTFTRGEQNIGAPLTLYFKINADSQSGPMVALEEEDFTVEGAAKNQTNNQVWQVVIPAGKSSAVVKFIPVDGNVTEWDELIRISMASTNPNTNQPVEYQVLGSSTAEITIFDNDGFGGLTSRNLDSDSTSLARSQVGYGVVQVDVYESQVAFGVNLPGAASPTYRSDDNLHPLLPVEWELPNIEVNEQTEPQSIEATTMFGSFAGPSVNFEVVDGVNIAAGQLRYVLPTSEQISQQLKTGHYDYNIRFSVKYPGDTDPRVRTIRGSTEIENSITPKLENAELGAGWRLDELDRLLPNDGNTAQFTDKGLAAIGGQAVVRGDNTSGFFPSKITEKTVKSDPQFGDSSLWQDGTYQSDQPYKYTLSGDKAKWTFSNLVLDQQYQVFATWVPGLTRASAADYKVVAHPFGSTKDSKTTTVDQRFTPGEVREDGQQWRSLGYFTATDDEKIRVILSGSGGETVAQSVMLVKAWGFEQPPVGSFSQLVYEDSEAAEGKKRFVLKDKFGSKAEFDDQGLLTLREDRNHNQTKYAYKDGDDDGLNDDVETITRQGDLKTTFEYTSGFLSSIKDFADRITTYDIDTKGRVKSITLPDPGEDNAAPEFEFEYGGPDKQLDSIEDSRHNQTKIEYANHRVKEVTNPDENSWTVSAFLLDGVAGAAGNSAGNAPIRKPATGLIGQNEIDAELPAGALKEPRATYTDARGNDWVYQSDAFGLITALAKPATEEIETEDVWKWERRPDGLPAKYTQPAGGGGALPINQELITEYDQYDSKGNLLHVEYADNSTESWQYNAQFAAVTKYTDQLNRETEFQLDSRGNVEQVKTMDGGSVARAFRTQYTAQPSGISSLPGGLPTETTEAYGSADAVTAATEYFTSGNKIGLAKKVTQAAGTNEAEADQFDYDDHRNLKTIKNALLVTTTNTHDDLNRLVKVAYPAPGTGSDPATYATFQYDEMGNLKESRDVRGVVTKTRYDVMNRAEYLDAPPNGGSSESASGVQTTQNFYDESGHIVQVKYPNNSGSTGDREATFDYDARNQHIKTTLPAPGVTLPAGMQVPVAGAPVTNYSYDHLGNLKTISDPRNAAWKTSYRYDELNRQWYVSAPATEDHGETVAMSHFDALGRAYMTDTTGPNGGLVATTYDYDRFDRVVTKTPPASSSGARAVENTSYDLRNNVTSFAVAGVTTETTYDHRDRPTDTLGPDPQNGRGRMHTHNTYNPVGLVTFTSSYEEGHAESTIATTLDHDNLGRVIRTTGTDPDGNGPLVAAVTTFKYDAGGNVLNTTVMAGSQSRMVDTEYDNYSRPWHVLGTPVGLSRTEIISVFGAAGENVKTEEKVNNSAWRTFEYVFDNLGRLFKTTGPAVGGGSRPETYSVADEDGNVTAVRDALGRVTQFGYDVLSRLKQIVEPAVAGQAKTTDMHYNMAGLVSSVTDTLQRTTGNLYDNVGNLLQTSLPALGGVTPVLQYTYDVLGNMTSQTDVQGNTTGYLYDGLGRLAQTLFPASRAGSTSSGGGEVYLVDDGDSGFTTMGSWTTHSPDPAGFQDDYRTASPDMMAPEAQYVFSVAPGKRYLVMATWNADSANTQDAQYQWLDGMTQEGSATITQRISPDDWGLDGKQWEVLGIADVATTGTGNFTVKLNAGTSGTTVADAVRLVELGPAASSVYDGLGRVIAQTNELGQTTTYQYDALGNQILVTLPDPDGPGPQTSSFTASAYDNLGQLVAQWNAQNETTLYGYNEAGQRTSITDPTNHTTLLGYDLLGRNTGVQDPAGNVTTFQYDDLDRKIGETQLFAGGGSASRYFGYDLVGNKTLSVDRNGRATVYSYDARDQLYSESWFGSLADASASQNQLGGISYAYDLGGRMVQAGTYAYGYDVLDRLVSETSSHIPGGVTLTTSYGNRLDGLRASVGASINGVADFVNQYSYDGRLQMTQILQGGVTGGHAVAPKRVDFVHGADGRLDNISRYADLAGTQSVAQTNFTYDGQDRLTGINHFKASTSLAQYGYSYDTAGRINGMSSPDGTAVYGYNDRGELTGVDYTGTNQPADAVYNYDANGNRADAGFTIAGHNQPTTDASFVYTYDAEGNRTSRTSLTSGEYETYSWDNRNRLIGVARFAADNTLLWTVAYSYDPQNRMIERVQTLAGQSPTTERFVYDGNQMVLATNASGAVTHRYLWGESVDQILTDESVDLVSGVGTTRWTLTDHQNSVRDIATYNSTNSTTSIVDHIIYDAFGKDISESSSANSTNLKFTGHYLDPLTGQQWNLNRWYDPSLHQWLSVDPILFEAGDPNPRRYVNNNPITGTDPTGLAEPGTWMFSPPAGASEEAAAASWLPNRVATWVRGGTDAVGSRAAKAVFGDYKNWRDAREVKRELDIAYDNALIPGSKKWLGVDGFDIADGMMQKINYPTDQDINRASGVIKVMGGVVETGGGVALILAPEPTMMTKPGGVILVAHGGDTTWAGVMMIWTGENQRTYTAKGVTYAVEPVVGENAAYWTGEGVDIGLPLVVGFASAPRAPSIPTGAIAEEAVIFRPYVKGLEGGNRILSSSAAKAQFRLQLSQQPILVGSHNESVIVVNCISPSEGVTLTTLGTGVTNIETTGTTSILNGVVLKVRMSRAGLTPQQIAAAEETIRGANIRMSGAHPAIVGDNINYSSHASKRFVRDTLFPQQTIAKTKIPTGTNVDEYVPRQWGGPQVHTNQHLLDETVNVKLGPIEYHSAKDVQKGTRILGVVLEWED